MVAIIKKNKIVSAIIALVILRIVLLAWLPLLDKTEARYAEIGRIMFETGNWITPQIDYNVPFWAKPPLSTWLTAMSFTVFGVNEFAARFPSFIIQLFLIFFVANALKFTHKQTGLLAIVLLTLPEYFIHCGVVSTDSALLVGITFMMIGFWNTLHTNEKHWKYILWLGVGLGMLAKGPIVLVLTLPPIFVWALLQNQLLTFLKKMLWIPGILIAIAITFPWYYLAEIKTPGFIDYFFVGEHYKRYFEKNWQGDKYGYAKQQPLGMIWLFLILFALPWVVLVFKKMIQSTKNVFQNSKYQYFIFWMLWTPLFFTISKSLIHTYTLPSSIPLAVLVVFWIQDITKPKIWFVTSAIIPVLLLVGLLVTNTVYTDKNWHNTDKFLLQNRAVQLPIYALDFKNYSAQFYTQGKIKVVDMTEFTSLIQNQKKAYFVIKNDDYAKLATDVKNHLYKVNTRKKSALYVFH